MVVKRRAARSLADLIVGKATGAGTMVRPTGKDEIWQASGISRYMFDKTAADWRDKSITTFTAADAEQHRGGDQGRRQDRSLKKTGAKAGSRGQVGRSSSRR